MEFIKEEELLARPKDWRTQFVNSLSGYKSANLIGTCSAEGLENLAIFSSVVHLGAHPPLMGLVSRPFAPGVERHSVENMRSTGQFTINQVHTGIYKQAHQSSARYSREESEFAAVGLQPFYVEGFGAPAVAEAHIQIGLRFLEAKPIEQNNTLFIIAEIDWVRYPREALADDGHILLHKIDTAALAGLDSYYQGQALERLPYAKPDKPLL